MSQSGYTPILLYASGTATNVPLAANLTSSASGAELAINYADGKLFYKDSGGVVQVLATKGGVGSSSNTQVLFNSSGLVAGSASLTWDGTNLLTNNITSASATNLLLKSAGTTAVTIDTSQNVGVGVSSPTSYFASADNLVVGTTSGSNGVTILGGSTATATLAFGISTGTNAGDGSNRAKIYYDGTSDTLRMSNGGALMNATQFVLDASGNLGLGVTPSAWGSGIKAIQFGLGANVFGSTSSYNNTNIVSNMYYNSGGTAIYQGSDYASFYQQVSGQHKWFNAPSGTAGNAISFTQAMTLDASGNLGVGTTSPKIQEWRTGTYLTVANASTRGQIEIDAAVADSGSASLGALLFSYSTNTTNHKDVALIEASSAGATANQRGGVLQFYTKANGTASPAERARIDSSGNFIIQDGSLQVKSTGATTIDCYPATNSSADFINRNGGGYNFYCGSGLPIRLAVSGAGIVTMSAYGAGTATFNASGVISSSDGRFKTKTRQVENALASVMALQPTYYRWNDDCPFHTEYEELGFIAQEVGAIIPEASPNEEEENKYKNYSDRAVIAVLVKAIQEQQALIQSLTDRLTALEAK